MGHRPKRLRTTEIVAGARRGGGGGWEFDLITEIRPLRWRQGGRKWRPERQGLEGKMESVHFLGTPPPPPPLPPPLSQNKIGATFGRCRP